MIKNTENGYVYELIEEEGSLHGEAFTGGKVADNVQLGEVDSRDERVKAHSI
jgi:hypothetical protein